MKHSQWALFGMGSVVVGVTVWYAAFGRMPDDLPTVVTGTLLAIGCFVLAFVGLEDKKEEGETQQ